MRYKAVFFDAGETLVHADPSFPELFAQVLSRSGHSVDPDAVTERLQVVSEVVADRFKQAAENQELWSTDEDRSKAFWLSIYRLFLDDLGLSSEPGLDNELYEAFSDHSNYALFPDVEPALEELRAAGLTMGVISNFEGWLEMLLEHLDVSRYFPVRVISGIEGVEKPDPEIFRIALSRAGIEASDAVYVGDNPHFDVDPAAGVGMHAVLLDRRDRFPESESPRVRSLEELPTLVGV